MYVILIVLPSFAAIIGDAESPFIFGENIRD